MATIPDLVDEMGARRVAVVTSPSVGALEAVRRTVDALGARVVLVDTTTTPHPTADGAAELSREVAGSRAEAVIGIGGGSSVDRAKLGALGAPHGVRTARDMLARCVTYAYPDDVVVPELSAEPLPLIAVPTTLSAAEWNGAAGLVDATTDIKRLVTHLELTPRHVVLDPALAATTPDRLWATTGARAIDHAIESLLSARSIDITDALSTGALRQLARWLPASLANRHDLDARLRCQWAAGMSIVGVHNVSLGLSHAIGHQLGARGVPHGVTSCITLPHVIEFLAPATADTQEEIRAALGVPGAPSAAAAVDVLLRDMGVRTRIRDVGIARSELPAIAAATMGDQTVGVSPRRVTEADVLAILHEAW
jgi:alcohol dehydrogenase